MTDSRHPSQEPGPLDRLRAALELWGEPPRFEYTPGLQYTKRLPLDPTERNQPVPLSPTAQAVFDAAWTLPVTLLDAIGDQEVIRRCQIAASLRTAAGCLQPDPTQSSPLGTLLACQDQIYAIAAELDPIQ